ncbi:conjugative transposon protein TraO [Chitinophaga skermanii]|uniref:Conjugative transposon protein TraO n=1 Tax=Chitinophaga skermanii TaxID=331697 RepID=A0A327PXJ3_9BACT|nr:conjugal transfer protein TraO [Chitinophaga skermanii]RAI97025.1 conjugative transposon protein TraO [Chitinophaga skermanii]
MKQLTVAIIIFLLSMNFSLAQVHQQGTAALDLSISKTGVGVIAGAGYLKNFNDNAYIYARGLVELGRMYNFKYTHIGLDLSAYYSPFVVSDFFQLNLGVGITTGYENIRGVSKTKNSSVGLMLGAKGGANIEAFLSDQVGFFVFANQAYMFKKSLGSAYYEVGVGLRIFLNNYY